MSNLSKNVLIVGAGDQVGHRLSDDLTKDGWNVLKCSLNSGSTLFVDPLDYDSICQLREKVSQTAASIDLLVINIDRVFGEKPVDVRGEIDYELCSRIYEYNTVGALRVANTLLPLMQDGLKRLCFVTTADGSNNLCRNTAGYGVRMSRAALNMGITQLFNKLRPDGFTFRLYCKNPEGGNEWAADYFTRGRSYESWDLKHSDEERIVLRDWTGRELPW